jgi:AraC-like DNA-binding protein
VTTRPSRLSISLDGLPPEERFSYWRDQASLYFRPSLVHPGDRLHFRMQGTMASLGPLVLVKCGGSRQIYTRDQATIRNDKVDFVILDTLLKGSARARHGGLCCVMRPGDVLLNDLSQASSVELEEHERISVSIPRVLMRDSFPEFEGFHGALIPAASPLAINLITQVHHLDAVLDTAQPHEADQLSRALVLMVALYFRAAGQARGVRPGGHDLPAKEVDVLTGVLSYVDAHLGDPELSVSHLLKAFKLSRTALYRLFEPYGGVAEVIRERRLRYAYMLLSRPRSDLPRPNMLPTSPPAAKPPRVARMAVMRPVLSLRAMPANLPIPSLPRAFSMALSSAEDLLAKNSSKAPYAFLVPA